MQLFCLSQMQTILLNFCSKLCIKKKGESYQSLAERRLEEFTDFLCFLYGAMAATEAIGISLERCRKYRKKKKSDEKDHKGENPLRCASLSLVCFNYYCNSAFLSMVVPTWESSSFISISFFMPKPKSLLSFLIRRVCEMQRKVIHIYVIKKFLY